MALVLTKLPQIKVNLGTSKWSAVHHPITFEFQRQDLKVMKTIPSTYSGNLVTVMYLYVIPPTALKIGQKIQYTANDIKYTVKVVGKSGKILYVERFSNKQVNGGLIQLNETYNSYYAEIEIYGVDASNTYQSIGFTKCSANEAGIVKVNVHEWLQTQAIFQNKFTYDTINKLQVGDGGKFNIVWREIFDGNTTNVPFTSLDPNNAFYWTNSSKQIKDKYSANMGDFNPTNDDTRTDKAKFLSVFKKPTYFVGYPFSVSFIYSDQLGNKEVSRREITRNINGVEVANTTDLINMTERGYVNRLMLKESYTSAIKTVDLWLESATIATTKDPIQWRNNYVNDVFTPFVEFDPIAINQQYSFYSFNFQ